jgi:hypothetical protein
VAKALSIASAILLAILSVVLPMTLGASPVVQAVLWTLAAVDIFILVFLLTPLARWLGARLSPEASVGGVSLQIHGRSRNRITIGDEDVQPSSTPVATEPPTRLVDLAPTTGPTVIVGQTFAYRSFVGPAILCPLEKVSILGGSIAADPSSLIWEIPPEIKYLSGVVGFYDCKFLGCHFDNIAIAVYAADVPRFREALGINQASRGISVEGSGTQPPTPR